MRRVTTGGEPDRTARIIQDMLYPIPAPAPPVRVERIPDVGGAEAWQCVPRFPVNLGAGPWQDEPDALRWTDQASGYACLMARNMYGAWCGYVGVPLGHPAWGLDYSEIRQRWRIFYRDEVNYAAPGQPVDLGDQPVLNIDRWWIGFDCSHGWDLSPGMLAGMPGDIAEAIRGSQTYRTMDDVRRQVTDLASCLIRPE